VVALSLPTTYSSSATVLLDPRKNAVTDLSAVVSPLTTDPATVQNQIQIITSRDLAATVVDRLKLSSDPEFNTTIAPPGIIQSLGDTLSALNPRNWFARKGPASPALQRERVIDTLRRHVWADAQGLSTTIGITATSRDAVKAATIANALADAYVKNQIATKIDATNATTDWLNRRISDLAQQLEVQQAAIQRYKATHDLNDSAPGNSIVDQQMAGISTQVVAARSDLAQKEAIAERIRSGNPADVTQIVTSPLIVQLRTQQATLLAQQSDLTSKYGPLHPKMQAIEEQKRDLDAKIAQEVNRLAASANNDVMVARAHLNSLQGSLGGTESTARAQNMARVQLQAMESNATSTKTMYEAFVQRLRQSQNLDDVQTPESRIISSAAIPLSPSGPKRSLIVGAALPLGLLLGVLTALLVEKFGPLMPVKVNGEPRGALVPVRRRARPAPVSNVNSAPNPTSVWNGPPILVEINDPAQLRAADFVLDYPASKYSHAIAALVRQLEAKPQAGGAVIAVTSTDNGESRSAIAVSLARAASKMGKKAILVDCAPTRLASKAIKAPVKQGLYDVLSGMVALNSALAKDPRSEAYLLSTTRRPSNALTMFSSKPMAKLASVLREGADFVVLDCGPAAASADAAVLARLADVTVLVSKRDHLHSPLIANAAHVLEEAQAAPVGIVVTK